ncbi:MAG: hypothetical protein ACE14V_04540 [bacterium]
MICSNKKYFFKPVGLSLLFIMWLVIPVSATQIVISGTANTDDSTIYADDSIGNAGADDGIMAGQTNVPSIRRALIRFNLSAIPSTATIDSVALTLIITKIPGAGTATAVDHSLYRLLNTWGEGTGVGTGIGGGTGGTDNIPGAVCWLYSQYSTAAWTNPGGDFVSSPSATINVGTGLGAMTWTGSGLISDVQGWVNGSFPNDGWILRGDETVTPSARKYGSSENLPNAPQLVINYTTAQTPTYFDTFGLFTTSSDTSNWFFELYSDGIGPGALGWQSSFQGQTGIVRITQNPGEKGKLSQIFSVPSTGRYRATARVATDIADISKQQKVYLYLQQMDSSSTIVASANEIIQPSNGGFSAASTWRNMEISFFAESTIIATQVVGINNLGTGVTGSLYVDYLLVDTGFTESTTPVILNNASFDAGLAGWTLQSYADATAPGTWSAVTGLAGHTGIVQGSQNSGEKGKLSQLYSAPTSRTDATAWVYSAAVSMLDTQKVYLYVYSYDSMFSKVIGSGNAIFQPGRWIPGQWQQLQFGYKPITEFNAVQVVGINPAGKPIDSIYFDEVQLKQE